MTDKVQKIREEVEKIAKSINPFLPDEDGKNSEYEAGRFVMVTQIMQIIDSLQEEPVSEDLNETIPSDIIGKELRSFLFGKKHPTINDLGIIADVARHFANWQKVQMMANAVDVTVHIDAGGYPYTPEIELYDYDKDVPLAKEGDKYKVVLIKEE